MTKVSSWPSSASSRYGSLAFRHSFVIGHLVIRADLLNFGSRFRAESSYLSIDQFNDTWGAGRDVSVMRGDDQRRLTFVPQSSQ